ncbi:MAG: hypothetical protein CMI16_12255 [Opitutaceae bacterium]|nr:hypothetical protein [Opitutaceae bacterium]
MLPAEHSAPVDHCGPRKVIIATTLHPIDEFRDQEERIGGVEAIIDQAAGQAAQMYPGQKLDLIILPEEILTGDSRAGTPAERAVSIDGPEMERMRNKAHEHQCYIVVPLTLVDDKRSDIFFNSTVLLDRDGATAGVYHKYHPVSDLKDDLLEGGITPGNAFPVFDCDFGKLGIQICWDMSYEDGWLELANQGAEIVALSTASPQTARPASYALRGRYHVVSSTHQHNASVFNPIGRITKQITDRGVMVIQLDLSYELLHWSPTLDGGLSFKRKYGDQVGFYYYLEEGTGIFWSNNEALPIHQMVAEMGEMPIADRVEHSRLREITIRAASNPG